MTVKNDKKQIMIYAFNDDAVVFKELQKEYKNKGYNSSALFHEIISHYVKTKEVF